MGARLEIERTGHAKVIAPRPADVGVTEATIAQMTAEALGVPAGNIEVTFGEGAALATSALQATLDEAAESLRATAGRMLRCEPDDVFLAENRAYSKLDFHAALDLEDVIRTTARASGVQGALVFDVG
jgi:CO/xanthine dehydrogenase Mo-binding subunit